MRQAVGVDMLEPEFADGFDDSKGCWCEAEAGMYATTTVPLETRKLKLAEMFAEAGSTLLWQERDQL